MTTKYELSQDAPQMVAETVRVSYNNPVTFASNVLEKSSVDMSPYTIDELDSHLEESEMQFMTGQFLSMEEADRDMELFVSSL